MKSVESAVSAVFLLKMPLYVINKSKVAFTQTVICSDRRSLIYNENVINNRSADQLTWPFRQIVFRESVCVYELKIEDVNSLRPLFLTRTINFYIFSSLIYHSMPSCFCLSFSPHSSSYITPYCHIYLILISPACYFCYQKSTESKNFKFP